MKKKYILVPDVHGRTFWKDILPFVDECERIIFFGDYHDPYPDEGITPSQSLSNFNEIMAFAKQHQDKVTMLLGNHDLSYYNTDEVPNWDVFANRHVWETHAEIASLFRTNLNMFGIVSMVYMRDINRNFLFSHAGVHPFWIQENNLIPNFTENTTASSICSHLTNMFLTGDKKLLNALRSISRIRGGDELIGSMVWADCHEFLWIKETPYTQVFGHTQQLKKENGIWVPDKPFVTGTNVCIDCHRCFYIDEEGTIRDLKTDEEIY